MALFSTDVKNRDQIRQWFASLPPDARDAYIKYIQLDAARQNYQSAQESGGRTTEALAKNTYESQGGDAGYQAAKENLQQSYPDVYKAGESLRQTVPGLGGGGNELVALGTFFTGMGLSGAGNAAAGAGGGAAAGGGATAAGGGLANTAGPVMAEGYTAPAIAAGTVAGTQSSGGADPALASGLSSLSNTGMNPNTLGALLQGGTALYAGQQGAEAADKATEELRRQFDIGQANTAPWLQAGQKALGAQQDLMGLGAGGPEAQLSSLMNSPGYQFRLNQGRRNLEASSAARGGMGSGKAGTAMQQFGQDYASNEYGNRLNQLAGLSGTGQTQAAQSMQAGMGYAGEIGNASLAGAQARQSGILGAGSALSNWMNPQPKQPTLADLLRGQ